MPTATRFVFLMHPREARHERAGTGRMTHLCLPNSEILVGASFDRHPRLDALYADPAHHVVLLYPGTEAVDLSGGPAPERVCPPGRRLVVLLLDATWSGARKMLKESPALQRLPRVMFTPTEPGRFLIKQQPMEGCRSTLESVHEVLGSLTRLGLERYERPEQLPALFAEMQAFQIACAADPERSGYRHRPYSAPSDRPDLQGNSRRRRSNYFRVGEGT